VSEKKKKVSLLKKKGVIVVHLFLPGMLFYVLRAD